MAKIATVNVVTLFGGIVDNIVSFSAIEDGHYEVSMGKEEYFLVHSS
jgi:hypothetical protein